MAENQDERSSEDLSEEVSQHRLEDYRRKGKVAQSREISGLAALLAAGAMTYILAPKMQSQLTEFMYEVFRADLSSRLNLGANDVLRTFLMKALSLTALVGLPVAIAGFVVGVAASFSQIGSIFSTDPLNMDLSKLDPIQGLKRMFSMKQAVNGVRLVFKAAVIFVVTYALIKTEVLKSPGQVGSEPVSVLQAYGSAAKVIFLALIGILSVFAVFDFILQKRDYNKNLRLTKQEAKQEHKEREGDPMIKARIRAVQREMARKRMMEAVKKADVIVTNPTHIAVAIVYSKDGMLAPKVVAKGADFLAQRIKKIASDAGVPLVENVPLARTLYKSVKVGQYIPRALYQAVAEVLAYVYRLKNKRDL
ncbi:MAG: flagellar biosynthesis protein FlhB [Bdellovibrionales bacterium GWB1_55_8]|nr:MAG: flagellar biosynthesis protein FlhB [Bdellovibrionales bacterium GWB1_55_8]